MICEHACIIIQYIGRSTSSFTQSVPRYQRKHIIDDGDDDVSTAPNLEYQPLKNGNNINLRTTKAPSPSVIELSKDIRACSYITDQAY